MRAMRVSGLVIGDYTGCPTTRNKNPTLDGRRVLG